MRCAFDFHSMGSDQLGLGPFTGSWYDFTIDDDGAITRASVSWNVEDFSPQVWEPFAEWVSTTYPEDAAVMYQDQTYSGQRLSEGSIQLWERPVPEYVAAESPAMVRIAQRFMEARNTYDADAILALLPEGEAFVHPMDNNQSRPNIIMGRIRMDREQLALAFEAEQLSEVRYDAVECRSEPSVHYNGLPIVCSYVLDGRLRQIAGIDSAPKSMRIGIRGGRVEHLSFPWLNVGFPSNQPAESWAFVEWLQEAHPDAGAPMQSGTLFDYPGGQEMQLILTPESLELLERYLDEYERAIG